MATLVSLSSYERGNESYSRGQYDEAIERYTDALESLAIDDELRARDTAGGGTSASASSRMVSISMVSLASRIQG